MNKSFGYTLLISGLGALVIFLSYRDTSVPLKELWFSLSLFAIAVGAVALIKYRWNRDGAEQPHKSRYDFAERLKRTGEVVKVTLDNSEVKSRSWQQEVTGSSWPSETEMLNALAGDDRNYRTREVRQTYIVLYKDFGGRRYKFVSDAIAHDEVAVRMWMDREGGFSLYVDKTNPAVYYFDMPAF